MPVTFGISATRPDGLPSNVLPLPVSTPAHTGSAHGASTVGSPKVVPSKERAVKVPSAQPL